ncbi:MAG TPA: hypothetical protein VFL57_09450 [Bryobacteraceae bacterium]|nr:hypothetical protein [Bryobacteraceae bacterium]
MFGVGAYLPEALRGAPVETTVLLSVHLGDCAECASYVRELSSIADEFRVWDARLRIVPDPREPSLAVADRYGQVFYSFPGGGHHEFPPPTVVAEALKFIGTLCPE